MSSFSSHHNSNNKEEHQTSGHGHGNQRRRRLKGRERESASPAPSPAPSILRHWVKDLVAASPRDWLSPLSCSGCLSQVDDQEGGDSDNVNDIASDTLRAQDQGQFSLLDDDEAFVTRSRESGRFFPIVTSGSTEDTYRRDIDKCARTTDSPGNEEEGVEVAADLEFGALKMPHMVAPFHTLSASKDHPCTKSIRLKNRSSAPRHVGQKRISDLIETVESMVPPLLIRDQVLADHREMGRQRSTSSSSLMDSLIDDTLSHSTSSSGDDQIVRPPSLSTITSPNYTTPPAPSTTFLVTRSRSRSLERLASPQVNRLTAPRNLRRTQSLKPPFSPPQLETKEVSPRSVLDLTYSYGNQSDYDEQDEQQIENTKFRQGTSPPQHRNRDKGSKVSLEGINFNDGEGSFFTGTIDLDWCCYDITTKESVDICNSNFREAPTEGCGGYVDYSGLYHPCTTVQQEVHDGQSQVTTPEGPCQGCIFRQGMYDGCSGNEHDEEEEDALYYDSDPGQHFAIESWTLFQKSVFPSRSETAADEQGSSPSASARSTTSRQRAKLGWRRRKKRHGKTDRGKKSETAIHDSNCASGDSTPIRGPEPIKQEENRQRRQEDQHAYLYDYFSQHDNARGNAMETGSCSTNESDVAKYVEEALNSKWRLQWHVNITRSSKSSNLRVMPPILCDLWVERGYRRNRTEIVEPKLMWSQLNFLHEKRQQLGGSTIRPCRVSLFAVRRIFQIATGEDWEKMNEGGQMQASLMPIAKPNCLLVVRSSLGEDYLFEASCCQERDHIVHLLKMATARLVSHAVVGNGDLMIKEFFNEEFVEGGINVSLTTADDD